MSEINTQTGATEESIQQSIEELGGIPMIEMDMEISGMTAYPTDTTLSIDGMAADAGAVGDRLETIESAIASSAADIADIESWTGADIRLNASQDAPSIADAVGDNTDDLTAIKAWTGADIPLTDDPNAPTIAEAIGSIVSESYPVGAVFMTVSEDPPTFDGTWVEIAITATWLQLKTGKRGYAEFEEGETGGALHFWMRTA